MNLIKTGAGDRLINCVYAPHEGDSSLAQLGIHEGGAYIEVMSTPLHKDPEVIFAARIENLWDLLVDTLLNVEDIPYVFLDAQPGLARRIAEAKSVVERRERGNDLQ